MIFQRKLYLCPPDYLKLKYEINPWMDMNQSFSRETAQTQWQELLDVYRRLIPENVEVIPSKEGLTELCFFGDSLFAYKNKALFSRFFTQERFAETEYVMGVMTPRMAQTKRTPEGIHYEGSGETMLWNNKILVGYNTRSNPKMIPILQEYFGLETIGLKLIDWRFFHLDTAVFPISNSLIAAYEDALSPEGKRILHDLGCEILSVGKEDARQFALNSIALGNDIIVHAGARNFQKILRARGFTVHSVDISEFLKFGGGIKCLTFQHYL